MLGHARRLPGRRAGAAPAAGRGGPPGRRAGGAGLRAAPGRAGRAAAARCCSSSPGVLRAAVGTGLVLLRVPADPVVRRAQPAPAVLVLHLAGAAAHRGRGRRRRAAPVAVPRLAGRGADRRAARALHLARPQLAVLHVGGPPVRGHRAARHGAADRARAGRDLGLDRWRGRLRVGVPVAALLLAFLGGVQLNQSLPLRSHDEWAGSYGINQAVAALSGDRARGLPVGAGEGLLRRTAGAVRADRSGWSSDEDSTLLPSGPPRSPRTSSGTRRPSRTGRSSWSTRPATVLPPLPGLYHARWPGASPARCRTGWRAASAGRRRPADPLRLHRLPGDPRGPR